MSHKNILTEINDIRTQMGLSLINEEELIDNELSKIDLDPLNEGWWENAKYAMSKLGSYKSGGKFRGKIKARKKADAKMLDLVAKKGNEMIEKLNVSIKTKTPEFPNNRSQEDFLNIILEIATVYDSIVGATKLKPTEKGFLLPEAANIIIEDLREYAKKYLDFDLKAAFSVFNESEDVKVDGLEDKDEDDIVVLDYGDTHKTKYGEIDNPMPKGTGFSNEDEVINEANADRDALKSKVGGKFADVKSAIKKGDLKGFDTERIKTLKSWRLPLSLMGAGASFGALSWLIEYMWAAEEIVTQTPEEIKTATQEALGSIEPGQGMTQILNEALGINLSASSNPTEVVEAFAKIGGGDASKGVDIMTQNGGIFKYPSAAKETLDQIVSNPTAYGDTLGDVFKGNWAGTGASPADTLVTLPGGTLSGMIIRIVTKFVIRKTIVTSAKVAIAAPIIKALGIALLTGGLAVKLARYKGKKSSRAQILNDLVQFLRPLKINQSDDQEAGQEVKAGQEAGQETGQDSGQDSGKQNTKKGGKDRQLYNLIKNYFKDIYNLKSQVNTDTYGDGGSGNQRKTYSGGRDVKKDLTSNNDMDDLLKLMESIDSISEETIDDIGMSSNQVKLFKGNVKKLTDLINFISKFNTQDRKLSGLINNIKSNPVFAVKFNELLESDPKSLKIFVSNFNKTIYNTKFKNGNDIISQLKKVGINKLSEDESIEEKSERQSSKKEMNKVYNDRREFLGGLEGFLVGIYSVMSYLIDNMGKPGEGDTETSKGDAETSKGGTETSKGSTETSKGSTETSKGGQGNSFSDVASSINEDESFKEHHSENPNDKYEVRPCDGLGTPFAVWEGDVKVQCFKTKEDAQAFADKQNKEQGLAEDVIDEKMGAEMELGQEEAVINSTTGRIFTQLSKIMPDLSMKIVNAYQQEYGVRLNRARLSNFLETVLGAMAMLPKQRMVKLINKSGMDVAAYNKMLKDLKKIESIDEAKEYSAEEQAMLNNAHGRIFTQMSKIIPSLSLKVVNAYQKEYGEKLNKVKLANFLETVLGAMAMLPKQRMVILINKAGMDLSAYNKLMNDMKTTEKKEEKGEVSDKQIGDKFNPSEPNSFRPNKVGGYNLSGQKDSFRIGLVDKAVEIISRNNDHKLDQKNVLTVMKQLIDRINIKHGGNIPKA